MAVDCGVGFKLLFLYVLECKISSADHVYHRDILCGCSWGGRGTRAETKETLGVTGDSGQSCPLVCVQIF